MEIPTILKKSKVQNSILEKFFVEELKDIYGAEKHLQKNLSKMQDAASSPRLKKAFEDHNWVTIDQISRLDDAFKLLRHHPQAKKCEAMISLVEEVKSIVQETERNSSTRDVALILNTQKIEHYEIATYGGLAALANTLGYEKIHKLLMETLAEEKDADELFAEIAVKDVNYQVNVNNEYSEKL